MFIFVAIGGFFGAIARFVVSNYIKGKFPSIFPSSTLFVNLAGSFLLGVIFGANLSNSWKLLLGTGFMGAFTTFSTFKLDSILLGEKNRKVLLLYLITSYVFGIILAFVGIKFGLLIRE